MVVTCLRKSNRPEQQCVTFNDTTVGSAQQVPLYIASLCSLEHFSKLREYGCLHKGDEIILTIRGQFLECKCSNGGQNEVESEVFTRAVCDVYFGKDPISPAAKGSVMVGIGSL
jgi:hypothetical protein